MQSLLIWLTCIIYTKVNQYIQHDCVTWISVHTQQMQTYLLVLVSIMQEHNDDKCNNQIRTSSHGLYLKLRSNQYTRIHKVVTLLIQLLLSMMCMTLPFCIQLCNLIAIGIESIGRYGNAKMGRGKIDFEKALRSVIPSYSCNLYYLISQKSFSFC